MATRNDSGFKGFTATATAISAFTRVTVDSNSQVSAAGAGTTGIGVCLEDTAASGIAPVKLASAPGTQIYRAAGAVTAGNRVYSAASGEISETVASSLLGIALQTAAAAGERIEVTPIEGRDLE